MNCKYYDFQNFIFNMFNYLDGRIGPVRSYGYKVFDVQTSNVIALTRPFNSIEIYTKNFNNFLSDIGEADINLIKTIITEILAHELSHVNQKINYSIIGLYSENNMGYEDYIKFIESSNIDNSIRFLESHAQEIFKLFGFILDVTYLEAKRKSAGIPNRFISKATCFEECWIQSMSLIFKDNSYKTAKNIYVTKNNGYKYIIKQNGLYNYEKTVANELDSLTAHMTTFDNIKEVGDTLYINY